MNRLLRAGFLLALVTVTGQAAPIHFSDPQDPITQVRLSDGRIVPFGAGTLCDSECTDPSGDTPTRSRKLLWVPLIGLTVWLVNFSAPGSGSTTTASAPVPQADVPEISTLVLLGTGMLLTARRLKK